MISWRKYPQYQNPRLWTVEALQALYKSEGTTPGMRVAITRELNARAGKTPLQSPQVKRQHIVQWSMMNATNTAGMLNREANKLRLVSKHLSDSEKIRACKLAEKMNDAAATLQYLTGTAKYLFPSKAKKKEKADA